MAATYVTGLLLGLALIIPIGAQNVFVLSQGLTMGMPRALWAVVAAGICDTLLIVLGAAGAGVLIGNVPGLREILLAGGAAFLVYLAVDSLRAKVTDDGMTTTAVTSPRGVIAKTASVSLLNPHAILDTVVVIGAAIAAQQVAGRTAFAAGALTASWIWFLLLAGAAAAFRRFLTPQRRVWFDRVSGMVMLFFAGMLVVELVQTLR
ncbi:LysE/ArgO family amino acid transporter [Haloglycomyces albus]|uniref:LysE/ArgO family amino acid transporter n=1 Tax=Haloglycomyces albus TaxID=526067 RepID=UPI00046CAE84|nr:LysE family transporter [Haloglycomyces albus]